MSLNLDSVIISGQETIKRGKVEVPVTRDRFGRFAKSVGGTVKKVTDAVTHPLETNRERIDRTEKEFIDAKQKMANWSTQEQKIKRFDTYDEKKRQYNDAMKEVAEALMEHPEILEKFHLAVSVLKDSDNNQEVEKLLVKELNSLLDEAMPPTAADKLKKAIRGVPGQVKKGMDALSKAPEKAIASADAAYKSASKEVKSAIDATVSSGLDMVQKSKKDICEKIGATGRAAQDAFSSVVKSAQSKGKGVKERIESAKKKAAEISKSIIDSVDKTAVQNAVAGAVGATAEVATLGVGMGASAAAMFALGSAAASVGIGLLGVMIPATIFGLATGPQIHKAAVKIGKTVEKSVNAIGKNNSSEEKPSKVAASGYISSSADSYLDYLLYSDVI